MKTFEDLDEFYKEFYKEFFKKQVKELEFKVINKPYEVLFYNKDATRYFRAVRECVGSDKLNKSFGGGSYWICSYGRVECRLFRNCRGELEAQPVLGTTYSKSKNGTEITRRLDTKKEVLGLIKSIGIFNI